MGADGIMMGTAFMATKEFPLPGSAKDAIVKASPYNPELRHRVIGSVDPAAYVEVMKMRDELPEEKWLSMLERVNLKDPDWKNDDLRRTDVQGIQQLRVVSLAAAVIDGVLTVKEFIDSIVQGAEELLNSYEFLKTDAKLVR